MSTRVERLFDVSDAVGRPGRHLVGATTVVPDQVTVPVVLCCVPGGGATGGYFDLMVTAPDEPPDASYSFAEHAAAAGLAVVVVDNLGTGRSHSDSGLGLTPLEVAVAGVRAFTAAAGEIRDRIGEEPVMIGVGHSMGALLTVLAQDRWRPYAGLALLGFTTAGLPEHARGLESLAGRPGRFGAEIVEAAAARRADPGPAAGAPFPFVIRSDTPAAARRAFAAVAAPVLPGPGLLALLPGNVSEAAAGVDVPVFLGVGDHEPWAEPAVLAAQYGSSRDVEVHVLPRAAHNHVLAGSRTLQWDRLCRWALRLTARGAAPRSAPR